MEGKRERGSREEESAAGVAEKCHGGSSFKRCTSHFQAGPLHLRTHVFPTQRSSFEMAQK